MYETIKRISQQPGKPILSLLIIMVLYVLQNCEAHGDCNRACFGPVWKIKVYNDFSRGMVNIQGKQVFANKVDVGFLYKISKGLSFYLYNATAKRFICWNRHFTNLVARKFKKSESMKLCEFKDAISNTTTKRDSHVELQFAYDETVRMKFNKKGRYPTRKMLNSCVKRLHKKTQRYVGAAAQHHRHRHQPASGIVAACESPDFLVIPECGCNQTEVFEVFCCSELRHMKEMSEICRVHDERRCPNTNETFYSLVK